MDQLKIQHIPFPPCLFQKNTTLISGNYQNVLPPWFLPVSIAIFLANGAVEEKIPRIRHELCQGVRFISGGWNLEKIGYLGRFSNMVEQGYNFH